MAAALGDPSPQTMAYGQAAPYPPQAPPRGAWDIWYEHRSFRVLAVTLLLAIIALLVWLLLLRSDEGTTMPEPGGGPVGVTQEDLISLSQELGQPVYWAGEISGTRMELSETSNSYAYLRYLSQDAPIGDSSPNFLTVGTYPQVSAYRNLRGYASHNHAQTDRIAHRGIAVAIPGSPTSVYFA